MMNLAKSITEDGLLQKMSSSNSDLVDPFATLDPAALQRVIEISKRLPLPGAQYTLLAVDSHVRSTERKQRWHVKVFKAGEAPPDRPSLDVDEETDDTGSSSAV